MDTSRDENGNHWLGNPIISSTPKTIRTAQRKQEPLTCPHCGKKYIRSSYHFKVHVSQCEVSPSDSNVSKTDSVHLDSSDISFSQLLQDKNGQNSGYTFKVPAPPVPSKRKAVRGPSQKFKKKLHLICSYCLKGYVCSRSYKTNVRMHLIQEAASLFPDTDTILQQSDDIGMKAMAQVTNEPALGESVIEFQQLLGHVSTICSGDEWKEFCHSVCSEMLKGTEKIKCLLPSALFNTLMEQQENILSDFKLSDSIMEPINVIGQFSASVCAQFFLKFVLYFTSNLLQFISSTFRANLPRRAQPVKDIEEPDREDRQVIYYIAGSIMRGYLKIGKRFPKSSTWQDVVSVLKTKVLIDNPEGDVDPDAEWTKDVDRGGLLFINSQCQRLFVKLVKLIFSCEKRDGSIDYEAVLTEVVKSDLSIEWDNIIGDSLHESVSLNLLRDVTLCFCRTCGRGFAKRRLNFIRSRPVASLTTRHLAANRKNR